VVGYLFDYCDDADAGGSPLRIVPPHSAVLPRHDPDDDEPF
jgi:hypothetical protein